jgi:hypothetical protein
MIDHEAVKEMLLFAFGQASMSEFERVLSPRGDTIISNDPATDFDADVLAGTIAGWFSNHYRDENSELRAALDQAERHLTKQADDIAGVWDSFRSLRMARAQTLGALQGIRTARAKIGGTR